MNFPGKSRSRSREKDQHKTKNRDNHKREFKSRDCVSSSSSCSKSRSKSREKEKKTRFSDIPEKVRNFPPQRKNSKGVPRFTVNNLALGGLILENRRTNERLDKTEVSQANIKFKQIDHSGRESVLLSAAINAEKEWQNYDEFFMEFRNGEYVKVLKPFLCGFDGCKMRFSLSTELEEHLKQHKNDMD